MLRWSLSGPSHRRSTSLSRRDAQRGCSDAASRAEGFDRSFFLGLRTPLLTLSLEAVHGEADLLRLSDGHLRPPTLSSPPTSSVQQVQIAPHPDDLKMKILELIDDVTKAAASARAS